MAKTKSYEVELKSVPASGAKKTMWRAGRQFEVKVPQVLDLTKEEVEVFENDNRFTLSEADGSRVSTDESESSSDSEADSSNDSSEEEANDSSEDSDSEDSSSDEAEEDSDDSTEDESESSSEEEVVAPTVDDLVRDNSRKELNALAVEAGVEDPEALNGKPEVAQAIVDAQANQNAESEATS